VFLAFKVKSFIFYLGGALYLGKTSCLNLWNKRSGINWCTKI